MHQTLLSHNPEQIFLIQGTEEVFDSLVQEVTDAGLYPESQKLTRFTVDEAKSLVSFNLDMNPQSWSFIYFDVFSKDAAEILLKTLEEPREGIYIVFVTPHPYLVPQTIRSRVRIINNSLLIKKPEYLESRQKLLEYIKGNFSDDAVLAATKRSDATKLFDALEQQLRDKPEKIKFIYEAKSMLFNANMPTKQVVEYLITMI